MGVTGASQCRLELYLLGSLLKVCIRIRIADGYCELGMFPVLLLSRCESQSPCGLYDSKMYTSEGFVSSGSDMAAGKLMTYRSASVG